jgi:hypothetical protein
MRYVVIRSQVSLTSLPFCREWYAWVRARVTGSYACLQVKTDPLGNPGANAGRGAARRPEKAADAWWRVELGKARCRFDGGLSTGAKTEVGRAGFAEAQRRR